MDSSFVNKIQKSKEYTQEPERVTFHTLQIEFKGENNTYQVVLGPDGWSCTCPGYQTYHICPHVMTIEKVFKPMLKRDPQPYAEGQNIVSDVKKSKRYSEEQDRLKILAFTAGFRGDNKEHLITYDNGTWTNNTSSYFATHGVSTHIMAMERMLAGMVIPLKTLQQES